MFWRQKKITYISVTAQQTIGTFFFDMKLQKISTTASPFAGISFVHNEFVISGMSQLIDNVVGSMVKTVGYI